MRGVTYLVYNVFAISGHIFIQKWVSEKRHFAIAKSWGIEIPLHWIILHRMVLVFRLIMYSLIWKKCFYQKRVSENNHFRHSQKLGYRNSVSLHLFASNGGGYVSFRLCHRRL